MNDLFIFRFKAEFPHLIRLDEIEVEDGWCSLLHTLCSDIEGSLCGVGKYPAITEVRVRAAGLHITVPDSTAEMAGLLAAARSESYCICEICGAAGTRRGGVYDNTRCDDCHEQGA